MSKEPETNRELYFYMEGKFESLSKEIRDIRKFVYWVAGISMITAATISVGIIEMIRTI